MTTSNIDIALNARFEAVEQEYINGNDSAMAGVLRNLSISDRRLLILYAELGSSYKVAELYNCSYRLILYRIKEIRKKFMHLKNKKYD